MPRTLTPYKPGDHGRIVDALVKLREARDLLAAAGATRALVATNRALKSTEGALRHADHRHHAAYRATGMVLAGFRR